MLKKLDGVLSALGDKRAVQLTMVIINTCLFILTFFHEFNLNELIFLFMFYGLQCLLFRKQWSLLMDSGNVQYKRFKKWAYVAGAVFFLYTVIPLLLLLYFKIDLINRLPLNGYDYNILHVSITYETVLEVLGLLIFYRPEAAAGKAL